MLEISTTERVIVLGRELLGFMIVNGRSVGRSVG